MHEHGFATRTALKQAQEIIKEKNKEIETLKESLSSYLDKLLKD